jgi:hypothetical protein
MSLQIHHFKSSGGVVTMVGSGAVWEGYQAEIDYFTFHAERFARFAGSDAKPVIAYQAADQIYGFRHLADGCHGAFGELGESPTPIALREIMEDLG